MPHLLIDGYNFMHRARCGALQGDYTIVYNFMRNLRSIIDTLSKKYGTFDKVSFVIEGHPVARHALYAEYKGNRKIDSKVDPKKYLEMQIFHKQKDIIIHLLKQYFPLSVIRHCDYECDDIIYNLVAKDSSDTKYVVISNDTDYIQLIQKYPNTVVWNPMTKCEVIAPTGYDYVSWKSIVGDDSDNIVGFKGIGPKTAEKILSTQENLTKFLQKDNNAEIFVRNHRLISFYDLTSDEMNNLEISTPICDWEAVKTQFDAFQFQSITNDKSWNKFIGTFNSLWKTT